MTVNVSPYADQSMENWPSITDQLIAAHPLKLEELRDVVRSSWDAVFETRIGASGFRIGKDIFPQPQIMAFFLHELVPLELQRRKPTTWRRQQSKGEKDIVHATNPHFSIELKASSHKNQIFGNRSYAQQVAPGRDHKGKEGYYLAVNFSKFAAEAAPQLSLIRFGWLDHNDWIPQRAATGQSARLRQEAYKYKLRLLWPDSPPP